MPLDENADLTGGMKRDYLPNDIDEVAKHCAFIKDTLETGGAGYAEPLWKYSLALAARCKEPEATAHRLSKGHAEYDPSATENKLAQSACPSNPNLGPPFCDHHRDCSRHNAPLVHIVIVAPPHWQLVLLRYNDPMVTHLISLPPLSPPELSQASCHTHTTKTP